MPSTVPVAFNAAHRLIETLIANDITHIFCVPGESYLPVLDALLDFKDRIQVITCRHEAGAANMAVAYGKLTGKPGVCFVTRGPGAMHASIGVHTAAQDSVPMILFVGQVAREDRGREAFQEVDYTVMFAAAAKLVTEVSQASRIVEHVTRAVSTAISGRQGPVVIALPEDMLKDDAGTRVAVKAVSADAHLDPAFLRKVANRLEHAQRPLLILGGTGWTERALQSLSEWVGVLHLPVILSWRRKDLLDNDHPCYIGDLNFQPTAALQERLKSADLVIALGSRLGDVATMGYTLFTAEEAARKLVHIHASADELNHVWQPALAASASTAAAAVALASIKLDRHWSDWCRAAREKYEATLRPVEATGSVNLSEVFTWLAGELPENAIVCNGAGNYAVWLHRFHRHRRWHTHLSPTSGAMGFGFPAAIAAKIVHPDREVVAVAGDGCFLMAAQELATAVQYDVRLITLVIDNGSYGTIRMHQERDFPGRVIATDICNPDFAAYARAFGAWGGTVERTADFEPVFRQALAAGKPAVIHIKTSVEDILPGATLAKK